MKTALIALILTLTFSLPAAFGEPLATSLPNTPTVNAKPPRAFTAVDYTLAAGVLLTHTFDYLSTEQGVREPARFRETSLNQSLVHSHVGLALYEASTASAEIYGAYLLSKHGHRRMARVIQAVNVGYFAKIVVNNYKIDWTQPVLH